MDKPVNNMNASLNTKMTKGMRISGFNNDKQIKTANWVSLSAKGSKAFPKAEIILNVLAINPSKISVTPEQIKTIPAAKYYFITKSTTTAAIIAIRIIERILGIVNISSLIRAFIFIFYYSNFNPATSSTGIENAIPCPSVSKPAAL